MYDNASLLINSGIYNLNIQNVDSDNSYIICKVCNGTVTFENDTKGNITGNWIWINGVDNTSSNTSINKITFDKNLFDNAM